MTLSLGDGLFCKGGLKMIGRFVLAFFVFLVAITPDVLAAPGDVDTTFNAPNGYALYDVAANGGDYAAAIAVQQDGKIVLAGAENVFHPELGEMAPAVIVLRYSSDGTLDPTFGYNGVFNDVITKVGDSAYALAIQPDGKILFGGDSGVNEEAFVGRLNSDGTLDAGFGATLGWMNGYYKVNYSGSPEINGNTMFGALALQPDGKIVLAVNVFAYLTNENIGVAVLRRNSDGTADSTFGNGGAVFVKAGGHYAKALAIQQDGRIVLAGYTYDAVDGTDDMLIMRFNIDGALDRTFGTGGRIIEDFSRRDILNALAVQPDGKIVAAGSIEGADAGDTDVAVLRFDSRGNLDDSFGTGGVVRTNVFEEDEAFALAIQENGKIVVTGHSYSMSFLVLRYDSNGSLDTDFNFEGIDLQYNYLVGRAIALQADGKILIAGSVNTGSFFEFNDSILMRLVGDPLSPETIIDNRDANTSHTGIWHLSEGGDPYGPDAAWGRDRATFTWKFTPSETGRYNVSMWWAGWPAGSTERGSAKTPVGIRRAGIPVDIQHEGGATRVYIDERTNGGRWNILGNYNFIGGTTYAITITSRPGPFGTCADAVKFNPAAR